MKPVTDPMPSKMTREKFGKLTREQQSEWFAQRIVGGMNAAVKGKVQTS